MFSHQANRQVINRHILSGPKITTSIFQLTWRCPHCGKKGTGPNSEKNHLAECSIQMSRDKIKTINGFIGEVEENRAKLREIDGRFWNYIAGIKNEKQ